LNRRCCWYRMSVADMKAVTNLIARCVRLHPMHLATTQACELSLAGALWILHQYYVNLPFEG
jgi:hypothetical protein